MIHDVAWCSSMEGVEDAIEETWLICYPKYPKSHTSSRLVLNFHVCLWNSLQPLHPTFQAEPMISFVRGARFFCSRVKRPHAEVPVADFPINKQDNIWALPTWRTGLRWSPMPRTMRRAWWRAKGNGTRATAFRNSKMFCLLMPWWRMVEVFCIHLYTGGSSDQSSHRYTGYCILYNVNLDE